MDRNTARHPKLCRESGPGYMICNTTRESSSEQPPSPTYEVEVGFQSRRMHHQAYQGAGPNLTLIFDHVVNVEQSGH